MRSLMLDIETFGTTPGCVVLSIGAVEFDSKGITKMFHAKLRTNGQVRRGLTVEPTTVEWWLEQDKAAQQALLSGNRLAPEDAIDAFIRAFDWDELKVWANGASFDFPILKALFDAYAYKLPWTFYNEMDFRTIKGLVGKTTFDRLRVRPEVAHDALEDARAQAFTLINIINWINGEHSELGLVA